MRPLLRAATIIGLLFISSTAGGAAPLSVHIRPYGYVHQAQHTTVTITVFIEKHKDNQQAAMAFIGDQYYSQSDWVVWGKTAPSRYEFTRKDLPAGQYVAVVRLARAGGKEYAATSEVLEVLP